MLGTKLFIKKLIQTETSTAEKVLNKVRELYESFKNRKSKDAQNAAEYLHTAEQLYLDALSEVGGTYQNGKIHLANREEDEEGEIRRLATPKDVDNYTEEQYNNFGWVRVNDVLESDEFERVMSGFASLKKGDQYRTTDEGESVIPASKYYGPNEGTVNAIVFVKGELGMPSVTRIWLLHHSNSQTLEKVRGVICERLLERRNGTSDFVEDLYGEEFVREYRASDFPTYQAYQDQLRQQREGEQSGGRRGGENHKNNRKQQDGRRDNSFSQSFTKSGRITLTVNGETLNSIGEPIYSTDVAMRVRKVWNFGSDRYHVENAGVDTEAYYATAKEAMDAENESLVREYAKRNGKSVSYVKHRLDEDFEFFSKETDDSVRRSRTASGDVVTISKGEMAKLHANYAGDKVFDKKSVTEALKGIDALQSLPAEIRNDFINRVWTGYNQRLHQQGFEMFTDVMWHQIHAAVLQENGFEMTEAEIAKMDEQIVNALHQIVASGKQSIKAKPCIFNEIVRCTMKSEQARKKSSACGFR